MSHPDEMISDLQDRLTKMETTGKQLLADNKRLEKIAAKYQDDKPAHDSNKRIQGHAEKSSTLGIKLTAPTLMKCSEDATRSFHIAYKAYEERLARLEKQNGMKLLLQPRLDLIDISVQKVWALMYLENDEIIDDSNVARVIKEIIHEEDHYPSQDIMGFTSVVMKKNASMMTSVMEFLHAVEEQSRKANNVVYPTKKFNKHFLGQIWDEHVKYNIEQVVFREDNGHLMLSKKAFTKTVIAEAMLYDRVYCRKTEPEQEPEEAEEELKGKQIKKQPTALNADDKCYNCGRKGHYQSSCTRASEEKPAPKGEQKTDKKTYKRLGGNSPPKQDANQAELKTNFIKKDDDTTK
jgi:hypothetical protein